MAAFASEERNFWKRLVRAAILAGLIAVPGAILSVSFGSDLELIGAGLLYGDGNPPDIFLLETSWLGIDRLRVDLRHDHRMDSYAINERNHCRKSARTANPIY